MTDFIEERQIIQHHGKYYRQAEENQGCAGCAMTRHNCYHTENIPPACYMHYEKYNPIGKILKQL